MLTQTIKVREITQGCRFTTTKKGDWIDLKLSEDAVIKAPTTGRLRKQKKTDDTEVNREIKFDYQLLSLGIAMELPKGFEAVVVARSSTFKNFGFIMPNASAVIDNSFRGNNDEWRLPVLAFRNCTISKGSRVCQFRIQLNQYASIWQKIKWLFTSKIRFEWVDSLDNPDRQGIGSTGI